MRSKKGFTLIEMLVVIAIIAVLVAVVVPTVTSATTKAKAATDAANLRSVRGMTNSILSEEGLKDTVSSMSSLGVTSKVDPEAHLCLVYTFPVFVDAMYVKGTPGSDSATYYTLDYLADLASTGKSERGTSLPTIPYDNVKWYDLSTSS